MTNRRDILKLAGIAGLFAGGLGDAAVYAAPGSDGRHFSAPDRIRYDGLSLFVEDKPFFLYSGSFHYARCPKALWAERFEKIREAGFNTVQTYVPWNFHEPQMPTNPDDFSKVDMTHLDEYLSMAAQFGLYAVVRVGPYMCGEWDTGGYPQWLITKMPHHFRGMWLRSDNPAFTRWTNHWMAAVCPVVARHQIIRKPKGQPGVILVQVENEYALIDVPLDQKKKHLQDLIEQAHRNGIAVPLFTNLAGFIIGSRGRLAEEVFDTIDRYPGWQLGAMGHRIHHYRTAQRNAPVMAAELQGGYFTSVQATPTLKTDADYYPDNVSPAQINALTLYSIAHGMTALNYYMLFGGTNFDGHASQGVATTYDYSAPIRECGGVGAKWLKVKAIGQMLRTHGPHLARAAALPIQVHEADAALQITARKSPDNAVYIFVFNSDRMRPRVGRFTASTGKYQNMAIRYRLDPGDFKIFYIPGAATHSLAGRWLPEPQRLPPPPSDIPPQVNIHTVKCHEDPLPTDWRRVPTGRSLADMGVYKSTLSYYRARMVAAATHGHRKAALAVTLPGQDSIIASVNGHLCLPLTSSGSPAILPISGPVSHRMEVTYVYENTGHPDNGWNMQNAYGIEALGVMPFNRDEGLIHQWRMQGVTLPRNIVQMAELQPRYNDRGWKMVDLNSLEPHQIGHRKDAVYRTELNLTREDLHVGRTVIRFGVVSSRGWLLVNGQFLGVMAGHGATANAAKVLRPGRNTIAIVVQALGGSGGMGQVQMIYQADALGKQEGDLLLAAEPTGIAKGWYQPGFDDRAWKTRGVGTQGTASNALLNWYRMEFVMPRVKADVWIPWCLRLNASGNGFIYINGHNIGRYWQDGGQREFYVPECWLSPHGKNVIALCLRPVDRPTAVNAAALVPYRIYAEHRTKAKPA